MHKVKDVAGQRPCFVGAGYDVLRVDVSGGELLVHVMGGLLVLETVIGAEANTLQANSLRRQQDGVVQEGHPSSDAECPQEPWADDAVVDNGVPAGGQSPGRRTGSLGHDLVLAMRRGGPGRDVALVDEREELVPRNQGAGVEEPR